MRIDSGNVGMDSARTYSSFEAKSRRFSAQMKQEALGKISSAQLQENADEVSVQEEFKKLREQFIDLLIRLLFPDKKEMISNEVSDRNNSLTLTSSESYYYEEFEETTFEAKGIVNCKDGRSIEFNVNFMMSRSFAAYYEEEIDFVGNAFTDPLVINLDGNIDSISDQTFYFDLDCDGSEEEISRLTAGSGFLALDMNDDGIINDGSELFGAQTGNGFSELSKYDTDKDGFIDEDDEIFESLKIWAFDESGESHLYTLKEKNVGAIYLGHAATNFSFNSLKDNSANAKMRSTGVFLFEDGNVGTISQIDFAARQRAKIAYA